MCIYIVIYIRLYCVSLLIVVLKFGEDGYVRIINIFVICKYVVFFCFVNVFVFFLGYNINIFMLFIMYLCLCIICFM